MTEKKKKFKDFETALERLEYITDQLESGEAKLDEAVSLYAEGVKTVAFCNNKLAEVEKKIMILKEKNGEMFETEFDQADKDGD